MIGSHQPPTVVNRGWRGVGARVVLELAIVVASSGPFGPSIRSLSDPEAGAYTATCKSQTREEVNNYM
jgi:hypothetical protein